MFFPSAPFTLTPPSLHHIQQYDLGLLGCVPLGFTDAERISDNLVMYSGGAEDRYVMTQLTCDMLLSTCARNMFA